MAFGGSTSADTKPHTHNQTLINDGGQLSETLTDMNGVTLFSLINAASTSINPDHVIMDYSTTIGDYTQPTGATCSSAAPANDISFNMTTRVTNQTISTDLGSTLSDSAWVLRGKLIYSTITLGGGQTTFVDFGVGNANHATPLANTMAMDFIGLQSRITQAGASPWGLVGYDSAGALDNPENPVMDTDATTQTYYVEIKRLSTTSMSIGLYSDAAFTTLIMPIETKVIAATITGLQYLRVGNGFVGSGTVGNVLGGTIEDFQIWDTVTSATGSPTYDNGTFVAWTRTGTEASATGGSSCANAVDNNLATVWQSTAAANNFIYVDVGSEKDLSQMALYPNAATTETQYKIQYSNDLVTWTDLRLFNVSALTNAAYNYIRFNTVTARYVRIYGNSGTSYVMAINEIKIDETNAVSTEHGHLEIDPTDVTLSLDGTSP